MSDNITIKKLLDLDETIFTKMSDITLEATVKEVRQAYERKVKSGKREGQPFYSQKLVINDGTGDIVVDFIANKTEQTIPKTAVGKRIKIEDAKTDIYKDERRLARGKVSLLNGQHIPGTLEEAVTLANGYYIVVGPNGKVVKAPEVDEREQRLIAGQAVAKSLIEAGRKWGKATEKEFDGWLGKIYNSKPKDELEPEAKKKPEENTIERVGLEGVIDKDFNRDKLIGRLGKRFGAMFVAGKTKGLNLEEWLNKNYKVKSFMALSDDYLVEIDSVFDDMFEALQKELGGK